VRGDGRVPPVPIFDEADFPMEICVGFEINGYLPAEFSFPAAAPAASRTPGHTLLSITAPFAAVPALVPDAKFKIETDLAPVIQVGTAYNVLVVNPSVPANSVAELIAYLKKVASGLVQFAGIQRSQEGRRKVRKVSQLRHSRSCPIRLGTVP
jgi:Tripartite tricarboxylate transporter family receptor